MLSNPTSEQATSGEIFHDFISPPGFLRSLFSFFFPLLFLFHTFCSSFLSRISFLSPLFPPPLWAYILAFNTNHWIFLRIVRGIVLALNLLPPSIAGTFPSLSYSYCVILPFFFFFFFLLWVSFPPRSLRPPPPLLAIGCILLCMFFPSPLLLFISLFPPPNHSFWSSNAFIRFTYRRFPPSLTLFLPFFPFFSVFFFCVSTPLTLSHSYPLLFLSPLFPIFHFIPTPPPSTLVHLVPPTTMPPPHWFLSVSFFSFYQPSLTPPLLLPCLSPPLSPPYFRRLILRFFYWFPRNCFVLPCLFSRDLPVP